MSELFAAFGIDWRLLTINLVNFILLLVLLRVFLYRPLLTMLESRQQLIVQGVKDAELAQKRLAEIESEKAAQLTHAASEADQLLSEARVSAERVRHETLAHTEASAAEVVASAEREATEIKRRALEESREEIAKLIVLGAQKVLDTKTKSI